MIAEKVVHLRNTVASSNVLLKAYLWKLRYFKPKVSFSLDTSRFVIKTVENGCELEKALNLRYEVFYEELLNRKAFLNIDVDKFDPICDHLVILDKRSERAVGTYRLISSTYSNRFYSETEFLIQNLKSAPGNKLELGRACVHRDYRNGITLALLWKGISEYMRRIDARYLFGCSSINTTNIVEISLIYRYLKEHHLSSDDFRVYPRERHIIKQINQHLQTFDRFEIKTETIEELIPPLLKSYIKAGAKVCGEPALDRKFKCADFLTVLDIELLNDSYEKRYRTANG
ncbi:MAG TPA: GNAT family N-acyltransferase [Thermodesulfobacteriota bacterium]|nr:GNAT family N-acyltransferase [Thermodesulfobacteriota bacterium]